MKTEHVLLAGGFSPYLFPISRNNMPKQFKKYGKHNVITELTEDKEVHSTFQEVVLALEKENIHIITQEKYKFHAMTQLKEIGVEANIILQPNEENLIDAIKLAFEKLDADRIIFFPTDQVILDHKKFNKEIYEFEKLSENDDIAIIISKRVPPSPRFGYVLTNGGAKYSNVKDFVEKPPNPEEYLEKDYLPFTGIISINKEGFKKLMKSKDYVTFLKKHAKKAYTASYRWFEVNTIKEIEYFTDPDEKENYTIGDAIIIDGRNNTIYNETIAKTIVVGLNNVEVVQTGDVTLVINKDKINDYEDVIEAVKKENPELLETGITVYRPWGRYTSIFSSKNFQIKILELYPGARISLQKHYHRSEHWVVVSGAAIVRINDQEKIVRPGESVFVPAGAVHQLSNPGKIPLKVVEVQFGEYLGEDDIVRLKDDYGRA